jgi:hypothetical protein
VTEIEVGDDVRVDDGPDGRIRMLRRGEQAHGHGECQHKNATD